MSKNIKLKTNLVPASAIKIYKKLAAKILEETPQVLKGNLLPLVKKVFKDKNQILSLAKKHPTPFYALDRKELNRVIGEYLFSFKKYLPASKHFYALKLNHHPYIIKQVIKNGFGLDVSSGRELLIALKSGAKDILFSGPGKTNSELELAIKNNNKVIINIDSFNELIRLGKLTKAKGKKIKAGVRIFTQYHGNWSKFGIPLADLKKFWLLAKKYPGIQLQGIQFHLSFNKDSAIYQKIIEEIAHYLKKNFSSTLLKEIKFFDFGGGMRPYLAEGYYPQELAKGAIIKEINEYYQLKDKFLEKYYLTEAVPISQYVQDIALALKKNLEPLVDCIYFSEPGRIICNNIMHIVLRVVDVKGPRLAVLDGGINLVGWERFTWDYFPLINLSHFSEKEITYKLYGSLCLPDDIWGNYCYAKNIQENDIILVPYQGALTYSLAQNFIKPIAEVYFLK